MLLSQLRQRFVYGDTSQPGREFCLPLESIQISVRLEKRVLYRFFSVFGVARDIQRDMQEFAIIPFYKFLKGSGFSILARLDQRQILVCCFFHCDLCDVFIHMSLISIQLESEFVRTRMRRVLIRRKLQRSCQGTNL